MATSGGELMSKSESEIWEFFQRQADNSQQWSRSLKNTRRIKRVNEVQIGETTLEIKEVKEMIEGLARQIASLSTAKSTELHDHDSYLDQANAISVMRKPSNYKPYSNTYNPGWRDQPNFSWSQRIPTEWTNSSSSTNATNSSNSSSLSTTIQTIQSEPKLLSTQTMGGCNPEFQECYSLHD